MQICTNDCALYSARCGPVQSVQVCTHRRVLLHTAVQLGAALPLGEQAYADAVGGVELPLEEVAAGGLDLGELQQAGRGQQHLHRLLVQLQTACGWDRETGCDPRQAGRRRAEGKRAANNPTMRDPAEHIITEYQMSLDISFRPLYNYFIFIYFFVLFSTASIHHTGHYTGYTGRPPTSPPPPPWANPRYVPAH